MNSKAMYNLSYGVFVLGAKSDEKINACITNTCMQVASDPVRVAISVLNGNLTCQMIKESGYFTLSILDKTCNFDLIRNFGMQSGRNVNKFEKYAYSLTKNGLPFIDYNSCAFLECKVVSENDLKTHTLFVAEVMDSETLSSNPPLTYADYQKDLKPGKNPPSVGMKGSEKDEGSIRIKKNGNENARAFESPEKNGKRIVGWRCRICGYEYKGSELPQDFECPLCGHPADDFEPIYEMCDIM